MRSWPGYFTMAENNSVKAGEYLYQGLIRKTENKPYISYKQLTENN